MKLKKDLLMLKTIGFSCLVGFISIPLLSKGPFLDRFDRSIIALVQGLESPTITIIMKFFTYIGSTSAVTVLSLIVLFILYFILKHRKELFLFGIVIVGAQILNKLLKQMFHRVRPDLHRLIEIGGYSFPSGHAMTALTFYGIITFLLWRHIPQRMGRTTLILVCTFLVLMIGISRVYLGVHYPSDIIGGYLAGTVWLTISISAFQKYLEIRFERKQLSANIKP